jgi:excisionase family DNA binding protein
MDKLLSIEEIAGVLGVPKSTVYSWTHKKTVPFIKVGRLVRFQPGEMEKWLKNQAVIPLGHDDTSKQKAHLKNRSARGKGRNNRIDALIAMVKKEILP